MKKIFITVLVLAAIGLVIYGLLTGLAYDVQHPFTPPPHP